MSGHLDFLHDSEIFVDLYSTLEVDMDAKQDEIKLAYIKLAKKSHPDHGGSSDIFQQITRAYEILHNKDTRKEYDLYYLKKSMDEFKGDDIIRLRDEHKNFMAANTKPISKEELDKLYADTFNEYKEKFNNDPKLNENEFATKINDISLERENMNIETSDDSLANFIKENGQDSIKINEVFEYLKYKNSGCFSNSLTTSNIGTLDTLPGYSTNYSSFMDENEYFGSNYYSDITGMTNVLAKESMNNLNMDEFMNWKSTTRTDVKLTDNELEVYLDKRKQEEAKLSNEIKEGLNNSTKKKEVQNFLKTKHLTEDMEKYYDDLEKIDNKKTTNIDTKKNALTDDIFTYMEKIKNDEFTLSNESNLGSSSGSNSGSSSGSGSSLSEATYADLKSGRELPKINNVRKREFK